MIERRIRGGKVYEVQTSDAPRGDGIRGAVIKREVAPNEDELWQMELARRVMLHINQIEEKA
jgi:hypothetical protein